MADITTIDSSSSQVVDQQAEIRSLHEVGDVHRSCTDISAASRCEPIAILDRPDAGILDSESKSAIQAKSWALSAISPFTPSDREDIAQELTLAWTSTLKRFDGSRGTLAAFRKTVLERTAANLLAKARSKKRYSPTLTYFAVCGSRTGLSIDVHRDCRQTTSHSSRLSQQQKSDLNQDVTTAIESLPPQQQELCRLLMHYSLAEVSRMSGVPESTVSSRLGAIRRRFQSRRLSEFL